MSKDGWLPPGVTDADIDNAAPAGGSEKIKLRITLQNESGELDGMTIEVPDSADANDISHEIWSALQTWTLAAGDTIKINER